MSYRYFPHKGLAGRVSKTGVSKMVEGHLGEKFGATSGVTDFAIVPPIAEDEPMKKKMRSFGPFLIDEKEVVVTLAAFLRKERDHARNL